MAAGDAFSKWPRPARNPTGPGEEKHEGPPARNRRVSAPAFAFDSKDSMGCWLMSNACGLDGDLVRSDASSGQDGAAIIDWRHTAI